MTTLSMWIGFSTVLGLIIWAIEKAGFISTATDVNGIVLVVGGLATAMMVNCSFAELGSALARFLSLFLPSRLPTIEQVIDQVSTLAKKAHREGGILSLQNDTPDFAQGFLRRAIMVAISSAESSETRRIMEAQIKLVRMKRQEDGNVFRTMSVLSPMFGLLGTLLGMVKVLQLMSDPIKAAAGMALALSSAFIGIGIANAICVPVAGKIRLMAMQETLILSLILEGVLDIASGKSPHLVELHLTAYSLKRQQEIEAQGAAVPGGAGGAA